MDERSTLFGHKIESVLIRKLFNENILSLDDIWSAYRSKDNAKNFIFKITATGVAKKDEKTGNFIFQKKV